MSLLPETFEDEMNTRLGRGYRLRRSPFKGTWLVEQQVGRAVYETPQPDSDAAIRLRDGYALVMETQAIDVLPCYVCGSTLKVPHLAYGEIKCFACARNGHKPSRMFAGYFPLCEKLLQRLESTSPRRGDAWVHEMRHHNARLGAERQRAHDNYIEAVARDTFNRVFDIPQVGYGPTIIPSRVH